MLEEPRAVRFATRDVKDIQCPEFPDIKLQEVTLRNGLKTYVLTGPNVSLFFGLVFFTPATSSKGTQHVLEHMVLDGSKNYLSASGYASFQSASDASLGAWTYANRTAYYSSALTERGLSEGAKALIDCTLNPLLSPEFFRAHSSRLLTERTNNGTLFSYQGGIVYNEMVQDVQHPRSVALRNGVKALFPELLPGIDYAGDPDGLKQLRLPDVVEYHRRFYSLRNSMSIVAHPTCPEPVLTLLEQLAAPPHAHRFEHPVVDLSQRQKRAHADIPPLAATHISDSSMVLMYPIAAPTRLSDVLYLDAMNSALFYLSNNRFTDSYKKTAFFGTPTVTRCAHELLGAQHFVAVQIDGLDPRDFTSAEKLITASYGSGDAPPLSQSALEAALLSNRHLYMRAGDAVEHIWGQLAFNWNTFPGASALLLGAHAQRLKGRIAEVHPDFCNFVKRVFQQEPFVFTQTPSSIMEPKNNNASPAAVEPVRVTPGLSAPLVAPPYALMLRRLVRSATDAFAVRYPFKGHAQKEIISTPIGDDSRIHLNIGFDLTRLSPDLYPHALELLNTLEQSRTHFGKSGKIREQIFSLSSSLTNCVMPVSDDDCRFFVSTSLFPEDLEPFLDLLGTLFNNIHCAGSKRLHGLDLQRDALFDDIYMPRAADALNSAFVTRGMAGFNPGFLRREHLVGLGSLSRYNKLLRAVASEKFSLSKRRLRAAAEWLFSSSSLLLQYSAPRQFEEATANKLRSFYDGLKSCERAPADVVVPLMERNDLLIAPTVTSYAGRFAHLPEYAPEYAPVLGYLGFLLYEQLVIKRGFYRSEVSFDLSTNVLRLRGWCGSNGAIPFKIYDRLPKELLDFKPTARQLKGLQMGALKRHLGRLSGESQSETMLRRLRLHNAGITAETFRQSAEDILANGKQSFRNFAEIMDEKRPRSRNLVLTGPEQAKRLPRSVAGVEFGEPVICTL